MSNRRLFIEIGLYAAVFFAALLLFAVLRVPSARLARVAVAWAENAGYTLDYDAVNSTLLPGFELEGVRISPPEPGSGPMLELDSLTVRTMLTPLFLGRAGVRVNADGYDGDAKVLVMTRGDTAWVRGEIVDVNLERFEGLQKKLQVPLKGIVDASWDFEVYQEMVRNVGTGEISIDDLRLEPGNLAGAFKIPGIDFGDVHGAVLLENGRLLFDRFAGDGQDVKMQVEGSVALSQPVAYSRLDLTVKMTLSERIEQALGFALPMLRLNKSPQGEYLRQVGGTLAAPR